MTLRLDPRPFLALALASMFALILSSCGPEKSTMEKEKEQLNQNYKLRTAELNDLIGNYRGTLTLDPEFNTESKVKRQYEVRFVVIPLTIPVANAGRNDVSKVPTLGGSYQILKQGFEGSDFVASQFNSADYDPSTNRLYMYGVNGGTGIVSYFEGFADGSIISGRVYTSYNAQIGIIDVKREQ